MIVCHCMGVSEKRIQRAVRSGARSLPEVAETCAAGTVCGGCHVLIEDVIEETLHDESSDPGPAEQPQGRTALATAR